MFWEGECVYYENHVKYINTVWATLQQVVRVTEYDCALNDCVTTPRFIWGEIRFFFFFLHKYERCLERRCVVKLTV